MLQKNRDMHFADIIPPLLYWYAGSARDLPWRTEPTPYHVWISEIMLQQTRVEAVRGYYERFLSALPTPTALAGVDDEVLNKLWQGLGYYSRARNLKKAAVHIVESYGGELPQTYAELRALPGVGAYTAGAIASIAYGLPEPAVDGNVLRVITRLTCDDSDILKQKTKDAVTDALRAVYPSGADAAALTQALMELGATVCVPNGAPHCDGCPIADQCMAHAAHREQDFPKKSEKRPRTIVEKTVFLLKIGENYILHRRGEKGLLAGLWEFPNTDCRMDAAAAHAWAAEQGFAPLDEAPLPLPDSQHIFTHIEWHMKGFLLHVQACPPPYLAAHPEGITKTYCVPSAFRAFLKQIESSSEGGDSL